MAFHRLELETIGHFSGARELGPEWDKSPLYELVLAASSTKGAFARSVVASLAAEAGVSLGSIPGRTGGRRQLGSKICEIKFSTELPARFQQVRPPEDGYDYLLGIGARPKELVYWLIDAPNVAILIDGGDISYQHADTSLWFFPHATQTDAFAPFRMDAQRLIEEFRTFR